MSAQALLTPHSPPVRWPPWASIPLASSRGCANPHYCPQCSYRQALCKRHRLVDHRASPSSEVLGVPGEDSAKPCHSYKGGTPPDTSRHLPTLPTLSTPPDPAGPGSPARQASWRLWLALCDHGLLTARRAGVCRSLCLCLLNVLSQQSDPGFAGSDLRGGRGPPSFHSHTDASLSSLDPTKLFAAPGAWPLFQPPECSDPKSPRGWFLLATQASGQNLHLLKECFLDQSSSPNPKSIIYFPFDTDCRPKLSCLFTGLFSCPLPPGAEHPRQEAEASLASLPPCPPRPRPRHEPGIVRFWCFN